MSVADKGHGEIEEYKDKHDLIQAKTSLRGFVFPKWKIYIAYCLSLGCSYCLPPLPPADAAQHGRVE